MGKKIIGKSIMALPAPFNAGSSNPMDTRFVVETLADLTTPDTFGTEGKYCFVYEGLPVYVSSEKATYTYMGPVAEGEGVLSEEVAKSENWVKNTNALELQNELKNIRFGIFGTKEDINFEKDFAVEMNDGSIYIVKDIDWNEMGTVWEGLKCVAFCFTTPFSDDLWYSEYYPKFNKVISLGDTTVLNNRIFIYGYFSNPDVYKNVISSDGHPMILLGGENNRELNFPLCGFNLSELGNRLYGFSIPPKTTLTFNHSVAYNSRLTEFSAWGVGGDKEILYEINITDPTVHNLFENCELPDLRRIKINRTIDPNTNYEDFKGCTFTSLPTTTNRGGDWENYAWTKDLVKSAFTRGMKHNPVWGEDYVADFTVFDFSKLEDASGFISECTLRGIKIAFPNLKRCSWGYLTSELKTIIISELGTLEKGCEHFLLGEPQNCLESLTINMENVTNTKNMFYHSKDVPGFAKCTYLHLEKLKTGIDISGFMNCSLESIKFIFDSALDVTASPLILTIYKGLYDLIPALWIKDFKAKGWNLSSRTADYLDRLFSYGAFTKLESELLIYFTHKELALKWENNIIQLINTVDETVISELDGSEFIKDGMVDNVEFTEATKILTITFNTASGKEAIDVDLSALVDAYNGANLKLTAASGFAKDTVLDLAINTLKTDITNVAAAVEALDATVTSTDGTNVQVKVTETNGKITGVNITTDNTAKSSDLTAEVTRAKAAEAAIQTALDNHKADQDKKHIPAGGHERQILAWKADGEALWDDLANMFTGLEELLAYGVEWDVTVADPHLTRIGNMSLHKTLPIQSLLKGCIAQVDKVIYWLDENDWRFRKDPKTIAVDLTNNTDTFVVDSVEGLGVGQYLRNDQWAAKITAIDAEALTLTVEWEWSESEEELPNLTTITSLEVGSRLDGYDGTVRVYCPNFYIKSQIIGNKRRVWLSTVKIDNTWTYQHEILLDAYRSTILNTVPEDMGYLSTLPVNSAISVVNTATYCRGGGNRSANDKYLTGADGTEIDVFRTDLGKPRTALGRPTMRTYSRNAGNEMLSYDQYKNVFYWLYVVEYANFNCQEAYNEALTEEGYRQGGMGPGVTTIDSGYWSYYNGYYPLTPCGYCNDLGNGTGVKDMTLVTPTVSGGEPTQSYTFKVPRWRGFDNPFGDIWTNLDGIIIDADADNHPNNMNYVFTCLDPSKYADNFNGDGYEKVGEEIHTDGYTKQFDLGDAAHIIPSVMGANTTIYKCDYHWTGGKNTTLRTLIVGGCAPGSSAAGLGLFDSSSGVSYSDAYVGFRSVSSFLSFLDNQ